MEEKLSLESGVYTSKEPETLTAYSEDTSTSKRKLIISILVVLGVAIAWVSGTQFSKYALNIDPTHFNAPYFMLWLSTNFMMTCFPVFCIYNFIRGHSPVHSWRESKPVLGRSSTTGFLRVLLFLVLWCGANYSYLRALLNVSASVATSISSCNAAIVWVLAMLILGDRFMPPKLMAVVLAVGGVVLISMDGQISAEWLGVLLAVVSATFTAFYKVLFKRILGDATLGEVSLFMSLLGLLNLFLNAIPTTILIWTGVEHIEFAYIPWWPLVGSGVLGLLFNFLINFGIALLHPLVISVGMLVGLPLNTVVDVIFSAVSASVFFITGSLCIICSFVLVVFPYNMVPLCRPIAYWPMIKHDKKAAEERL